MSTEEKILKASERRAVIKRILNNERQSVGSLQLSHDNGDHIGIFFTMEKPWKHNILNESCIRPDWVYVALPHVSPSQGKCFKVYELNGKEVIGRSQILFHAANFNKDIKGCIGPGTGIADINRDGDIDVTSSRAAMDVLLAQCPDGFLFHVVNA